MATKGTEIPWLVEDLREQKFDGEQSLIDRRARKVPDVFQINEVFVDELLFELINRIREKSQESGNSADVRLDRFGAVSSHPECLTHSLESSLHSDLLSRS